MPARRPMNVSIHKDRAAIGRGCFLAGKEFFAVVLRTRDWAADPWRHNDDPGLCAPVFKNKKKSACLRPRFPAYLASVRGPICLTLATTSLLVISSAAAYAQALAPSTLH